MDFLNIVKNYRPRSLSRSFKLASVIIFVILICLQLMAYYNRNYEKQLLMQQKYSDLVREQKEKASMERKTKVNINELEGVNDFKYSRDPNKSPDSLFLEKKVPSLL